MFLTKDISLEENVNVYQAHLICINWDAVNYQLSGFQPLLNFKKSSNIHYNIWVHFIFIWVNILLYFISFVLFWETENKEKLKVIWRLFPTNIWVLQYFIMQPFLPIIFYFFANKSFWPKSSINSMSPIPNLRQLKFTIMWQYKF